MVLSFWTYLSLSREDVVLNASTCDVLMSFKTLCDYFSLLVCSHKGRNVEQLSTNRKFGDALPAVQMPCVLEQDTNTPLDVSESDKQRNLLFMPFASHISARHSADLFL